MSCLCYFFLLLNQLLQVERLAHLGYLCRRNASKVIRLSFVGVTLGVMYNSSAVVLVIDNARVAIVVECDAVIKVSLCSSLVDFLTQKQNH